MKLFILFVHTVSSKLDNVLLELSDLIKYIFIRYLIFNDANIIWQDILSKWAQDRTRPG